MVKKLFDTNELNYLYENITFLFAPFDKSENNNKPEDLSSGQISEINYILEKLDDNHLFKNNFIIQLCFYDLMYFKIKNIKKHVVSNIVDEDNKSKISFLVEEWLKTINVKRKLLQKEVMKDYYGTFGDKLSKLLKDKKYTITEFAELLGLSRTSVSDYCNKKSFPDNFYKLLQISNLLGCNVQYLIDPDTELPEPILQAIYKDIGLTEASIEKLRDIMYLQNTKGIMRALNILIEYIEVDYVCEYDVLTSIATYFGVYPFNEPKHLISENLINKYQEEFNEIGSVEEAQSKFNSFIRDLKYDSVDVKSFERQHILYLCDIQEKLLRMKRELDAIDEPEKFITSNVYTEYLEGLERMKIAIQEQEERNK